MQPSARMIPPVVVHSAVESICGRGGRVRRVRSRETSSTVASTTSSSTVSRAMRRKTTTKAQPTCDLIKTALKL